MDENFDEMINYIESRIFAGDSVRSIDKTTPNISKNKIYKLINELNDENSEHYDQKRYLNLRKKQMENAQRIKLESVRKNNNVFVERIPKTDQKYFDLKNSVFCKHKYPILKEIVLMALTYRVSVKNLAKLFKTSIEDVEYLFKMVDEFEDATLHLCDETKNENEEASNKAFKDAQNYWRERNKIIKLINYQKKQKDNQEILEKLNERLREHRALIEDRIFKEAIAKQIKDLTEEEKEAIAKFRMKYNLSTHDIIDMKCSKEKIKILEEEISKKDPIFATKLTFLNYTHQRNFRLMMHNKNSNFENNMKI